MVTWRSSTLSANDTVYRFRLRHSSEFTAPKNRIVSRGHSRTTEVRSQNESWKRCDPDEGSAPSELRRVSVAVYTTIKNVVLGTTNIYAYAAHVSMAGLLNE